MIALVFQSQLLQFTIARPSSEHDSFCNPVMFPSRISLRLTALTSLDFDSSRTLRYPPTRAASFEQRGAIVSLCINDSPFSPVLCEINWPLNLNGTHLDHYRPNRRPAARRVGRGVGRGFTRSTIAPSHFRRCDLTLKFDYHVSRRSDLDSLSAIMRARAREANHRES